MRHLRGPLRSVVSAPSIPGPFCDWHNWTQLLRCWPSNVLEYIVNNKFLIVFVLLKVIDVIVDVVANHKGFFAFRLCPNNNPTKAPPAECFAKHPLKLANGESFYFLQDPKVKQEHHQGLRVQLQLKLPDGLHCWQCIIQWTYVAGTLKKHTHHNF